MVREKMEINMNIFIGIFCLFCLLSYLGVGECVASCRGLWKTEQAINVTATSATLVGQGTKSDSMGDPGSSGPYFEYGTSTSYGTKTSSIQYDFQSCKVFANINNLTPHQTYHVRIVETYLFQNTWHTSYGDDKTFTTFDRPTVTTGAATDITSTSVVLNGTVNPNGGNTKAFFNYRPETCVWNCLDAKSVKQDISPVNIPVNITTKLDNLKAGLKWYYSLEAENQNGKSKGEEKTFFTTSKPIVTTLSATEIGTHAATLNAWVNPAGFDTMYYFEYGETSAYGIKKSPVYAGKGTELKSVSLPLPNSFDAGKTYHFRIVATNTLGTSYGDDKTFSAEKIKPPSAVTGDVASVTISTAVLKGVVNPHNDQTMWHFDYRKTGGDWKKTVDVGANVENDWNVEAQVWDLEPDTIYAYKITAKNGGGTISGDEKTFKTSSLSLPSATTNEANNVTKTSVTITGTVNPHGVPTSYWFWYGKSKSYTDHTPGKTGIMGINDIAVSEDITGLSPNTIYYYRIAANNVKGSVQGEDKSFATLSARQEVTTGNAINVATSAAKLTGSITPNELAITWWFEYGKTTTYGQKTSGLQESFISGTLSVARDIDGLSAGTTYHYRIGSQSSAGIVYGADKTFTTIGMSPGNKQLMQPLR